MTLTLQRWALNSISFEAWPIGTSSRQAPPDGNKSGGFADKLEQALRGR